MNAISVPSGDQMQFRLPRVLGVGASEANSARPEFAAPVLAVQMSALLSLPPRRKHSLEPSGDTAGCQSLVEPVTNGVSVPPIVTGDFL